MRIIGGSHKGRVLKVVKGLELRPTTDFAKEGLFNVLNSRLEFEALRVLDLFSGTGNISLEFASRGSKVTAVDQNAKCCHFLRSTAGELQLPVQVSKEDVFAFLKNTPPGSFDLVFADPPYALDKIPLIHTLVEERRVLVPGGLLVIEHGPRTHLDTLSGFVQQRKYGNVNFSFFQAPALPLPA